MRKAFLFAVALGVGGGLLLALIVITVYRF